MGDGLNINQKYNIGLNFDGESEQLPIYDYRELIKETPVMNTSKEKAKNLLQGSRESVSAFGDEIICESDNLKIQDNKTVDKIKTQKTSHKSNSVKPIDTTYSRDSSFIYDEPVNIDKNLFNQALNKILPENSLLKNKGECFCIAATNCTFKDNKAGIKYITEDPNKQQADPFLIAAISLHESGFGTSALTRNKNNIAGLGTIDFKSAINPKNNDGIDTSILYLGAYMNKLATKNNLTTVKTVALSNKYCALSGSADWIRNVTRYAEKLKTEYNKLVIEKYGDQLFKEALNLD